ncbi:unnamed protein product [Closterium sp. NIES-64]|nr:unnamed protein product [Closterium sp. NIES-64]CAI6010029.1 unnamed protein product [Closterium sp. NIES-65]
MIRTAPIHNPRIPFVVAALASPSLRTCLSFSRKNPGVRVSGRLSATRGAERKRGVSCFSGTRVFSSMAQGQQVAGIADDRVSLGDDASSRIQLYSFATPNGMKVSIALEEMQLPYDAHMVNIMKGEQFNREFIAINPNNKIPAIVDPKAGPGGTPLKIFESGAILLYLAEKSGKFLPQDAVQRWETISWLFFQVGGVGPMFGQFGMFYKFAREQCDHPYPLQRYTEETRRLLGVLEKRLEGREFLVDAGYTIADMATFPWVNSLQVFYKADDQLHLSSYPRVLEWKDRCMARPLTAKGMLVCSVGLR